VGGEAEATAAFRGLASDMENATADMASTTITMILVVIVGLHGWYDYFLMVTTVAALITMRTNVV
jgi:hypothetical protein